MLSVDVENIDTLRSDSLSYATEFRGLFEINGTYLLYCFTSMFLPLFSHVYLGYRLGLTKFVRIFCGLCLIIIGAIAGNAWQYKARIKLKLTVQ